MTGKPSVLILGGLPTVSRCLASFLVPKDGEPLVSHLRIVDKYSVTPATTYLGSAFAETIKNSIVQYQQANLLIPATIAKSFDHPEGWQPFSYVFDCTGDTTFDRANEIHRDQTAKLAYHIGKEAARRKVAAYVRVHYHYYFTSLEKTRSGEAEDLKPIGARGIWWHEAVRMLGGIPDLNLVVVRIGAAYGPYLPNGLVTPRITMGRVYQHLNEEMKYLWNAGMRLNTVHVDDIAGAMWALAEWMKPLGRAKANEQAGEVIHFHAPDNKALLQGLEGHLPGDQNPTVPFFNLVDDSDTTQETLGKIIAQIFGLKFGFYGFIVNTKVKIDFDHMVEDINSKHVEAWADICMKSTPPLMNPTVQGYVDGYMFEKWSVAYTGEKIKRVVGYRLKRPKLTSESLKEIIYAFRNEGNWPNYEDRV